MLGTLASPSPYVHQCAFPDSRVLQHNFFPLVLVFLTPPSLLSQKLVLFFVLNRCWAPSMTRTATNNNNNNNLRRYLLSQKSSFLRLFSLVFHLMGAISVEQTVHVDEQGLQVQKLFVRAGRRPVQDTNEGDRIGQHRIESRLTDGKGSTTDDQKTFSFLFINRCFVTDRQPGRPKQPRHGSSLHFETRFLSSNNIRDKKVFWSLGSTKWYRLCRYLSHIDISLGTAGYVASISRVSTRTRNEYVRLDSQSCLGPS